MATKLVSKNQSNCSLVTKSNSIAAAISCGRAPPNRKVGCSIHGHCVTRCSAP